MIISAGMRGSLTHFMISIRSALYSSLIPEMSNCFSSLQSSFPLPRASKFHHHIMLLTPSQAGQVELDLLEAVVKSISF